MNKNTCINPEIIFITELDKHLGFGDDLMVLQFAVQNAYAFHTNPQEIIDIIHPTTIKTNKYTNYNRRIKRLLKMRLRASITHTICFKIIDFIDKKIHHIKDNQYICYPLQEDDLFSKELQKFLIKYFKQNPLDKKRDADGWQYVRKIQNDLLDFDNRVGTFDVSDMNVNIFQHKTYTEKILVGWPPGEKFRGNTKQHAALKSTFFHNFDTLITHNNLISNDQYKFIPYKRFLDDIPMFDWYENCKFAIGPEGGNWHLARLTNAPYVLVIPNYLFNKIQTAHDIRYYFDVIRRQNRFLRAPEKIAPAGIIFEDSYVKEIANLEGQIDCWLQNHKKQTAIFLPSKPSTKEKYKKIADLLYEYFNPITECTAIY